MAELFEAEEREAAGETAGPEHLLLAALALPDGTAREALETLGISPADVRDALEAVHADALASIGIEAVVQPQEKTVPSSGGRPYLTTATSRECFRRAVSLAKASRSPLRSGHILLSVSQLEHGTAARMMSKLAVDRSALAQATAAALDPS